MVKLRGKPQFFCYIGVVTAWPYKKAALFGVTRGATTAGVTSHFRVWFFVSGCTFSWIPKRSSNLRNSVTMARHSPFRGYQLGYRNLDTVVSLVTSLVTTAWKLAGLCANRDANQILLTTFSLETKLETLPWKLSVSVRTSLRTSDCEPRETSAKLAFRPVGIALPALNKMLRTLTETLPFDWLNFQHPCGNLVVRPLAKP